jgi:preprotein translocase subunit YajC
MTLLYILLQAQQPGGGGAQTLIFFLLIIVVFYFFMIRPQMRKAKLEKNYREKVQKGDKIVTIGGIHGRIIDVDATTFLVEVDNNVKLRIEKNAIAVDATKAVSSQK